MLYLDLNIPQSSFSTNAGIMFEWWRDNWKRQEFKRKEKGAEVENKKRYYVNYNSNTFLSTIMKVSNMIATFSFRWHDKLFLLKIFDNLREKKIEKCVSSYNGGKNVYKSPKICLTLLGGRWLLNGYILSSDI